MTPWQLAKESEHSQQVALFCFCARASKIGFKHAKEPNNWLPGVDYSNDIAIGVPELAFFHAIPNGGNRGDSAKSRAIEGGRMKAEGVKPGVLDCFWPLKRADQLKSGGSYCGLYIEMKKPALKSKTNPESGCSDEQKAFGKHVTEQGYFAVVCYSWLEAAEVLEWYYNL